MHSQLTIRQQILEMGIWKVSRNISVSSITDNVSGLVAEVAVKLQGY